MSEDASLLATCWRRVEQRVAAIFQSLSTGQAWLETSVACALALSMFITCPRLSFFTGKDAQVLDFWQVIEKQAAHPLAPETTAHDLADHPAKGALRLTVPVLARVFHLGWIELLLLQVGLGVVLLYLTGRYVYQLFGDRVAAIACVFAVSSLYSGKAAFLQIGGIGDGFALPLLAVAATLSFAPVVFGAMLMACFTDERAILAAPLVVLCSILRARQVGQTRRMAAAVSATVAIAVSLGLRWYLGFRYGLHTPVGSGVGVGLDVVVYNLPTLQFTLARSLAGCWIWVGVAIYFLARLRRWLWLAATILPSVAIIAAGFAVYDVDRSLAYLYPLLLASFAVCAQGGMNRNNARQIAIASFLVSLLLPVNSFFVADNRYSPGNLLPVEIVRLIQFAR